MSTAPAFLFDLDGTLADTLGDIAASTNHVRQRHGLAPVGAGIVRTFVGDGARMLLRRALAPALPNLQETDAVDAALDAAFAEYVTHHEQQCTATAQLYPGVRPFLDRLFAAGHPMAIVTNKPGRFALPVVRHLGLEDRFRVVIAGDTLAVRKPDAAPLRHALDRLGSASRGAVMIGDGVQDVRAGKALGIRTIACLFGFTDGDRLRAEGADEYWHEFGGAGPKRVSETTARDR